jgi:hypothetical protein
MIFLYVFMLTTSCMSALIGEINAQLTAPQSASVKLEVAMSHVYKFLCAMSHVFV